MPTSKVEVLNAMLIRKTGPVQSPMSPTPFVVAGLNSKRYAPAMRTLRVKSQPPIHGSTTSRAPLDPSQPKTVVPKTGTRGGLPKPTQGKITDVPKAVPLLRGSSDSSGHSLFRRIGVPKASKTVPRSLKEGKVVGARPAPVTVSNKQPPRPSCVPSVCDQRSSVGYPTAAKGKKAVAAKVPAIGPLNSGVIYQRSLVSDDTSKTVTIVKTTKAQVRRLDVAVRCVTEGNQIICSDVSPPRRSPYLPPALTILPPQTWTIIVDSGAKKTKASDMTAGDESLASVNATKSGVSREAEDTRLSTESAPVFLELSPSETVVDTPGPMAAVAADSESAVKVGHLAKVFSAAVSHTAIVATVISPSNLSIATPPKAIDENQVSSTGTTSGISNEARDAARRAIEFALSRLTPSQRASKPNSNAVTFIKTRNNLSRLTVRCSSPVKEVFKNLISVIPESSPSDTVVDIPTGSTVAVVARSECVVKASHTAKEFSAEVLHTVIATTVTSPLNNNSASNSPIATPLKMMDQSQALPASVASGVGNDAWNAARRAIEFALSRQRLSMHNDDATTSLKTGNNLSCLRARCSPPTKEASENMTSVLPVLSPFDAVVHTPARPIVAVVSDSKNNVKACHAGIGPSAKISHTVIAAAVITPSNDNRTSNSTIVTTPKATGEIQALSASATSGISKEAWNAARRVIEFALSRRSASMPSSNAITSLKMGNNVSHPRARCSPPTKEASKNMASVLPALSPFDAVVHKPASPTAAVISVSKNGAKACHTGTGLSASLLHTVIAATVISSSNDNCTSNSTITTPPRGANESQASSVSATSGFGEEAWNAARRAVEFALSRRCVSMPSRDAVTSLKMGNNVPRFRARRGPPTMEASKNTIPGFPEPPPSVTAVDTPGLTVAITAESKGTVKTSRAANELSTEASHTVITGMVISPSNNSSIATPPKAMDKSPALSASTTSRSGNSARDVPHCAVTFVLSRPPPPRCVSIPGTNFVASVKTNNVSRLRARFSSPTKEAFKNPITQLEIGMLRELKMVAGTGMVDPRLGRYDSLSAMAIANKKGTSDSELPCHG